MLKTASANKYSSKLKTVCTQPGLTGADDGLGPAGFLQLAKDIRDMITNRFEAYNQAFGDLAVIAPVGYQLQNFKFTFGKFGGKM